MLCRYVLWTVGWLGRYTAHIGLCQFDFVIIFIGECCMSCAGKCTGTRETNMNTYTDVNLLVLCWEHCGSSGDGDG